MKAVLPRPAGIHHESAMGPVHSPIPPAVIHYSLGRHRPQSRRKLPTPFPILQIQASTPPAPRTDLKHRATEAFYTARTCHYRVHAPTDPSNISNRHRPMTTPTSHKLSNVSPLPRSLNRTTIKIVADELDRSQRRNTI